MEACEHCGGQHAPEHLYCPATGKLIASRLLPRHTMLEDKYLIGDPVGVGGMGAVFEAKHTLLDKKVAIKVMLGQDEEGTQRLIREARAASSTGHPNITSVTDMGRTAQGSLFVVMEFLEGRTIKELMRAGPIESELALRLGDQVLAGLEAVHRKGIVHRDLKPDNLMVAVDDDGMEMVKILDFGISKVLQDESSQQGLTQTGLVMGTPLFMAPEQARGDNAAIGPATDLYAVGAILYAMLTGQPPHVADTLAALISAKLEQPVVPPSHRVAGIAPGIDRLVMRALDNEPKHRFADARAMRVELLGILGESAPLQGGPSSPGLALSGSSQPSIPVAPPRRSEEDLAGLDALDSLSLGDELVALDESDGDLGAPTSREPPRAAPAQPALPTPAQTLSPSPSAPALAKRKGAQPHDPFAPPEEGGDLEMELALERERAPIAAVRSAEVPPPQAPARAAAMYQGAARKKSPLPLVMTLVVIAALAGGAYYYFTIYKKKETTAPSVGEEVTVRFIVTPPSAQVLVDGYGLSSHTLTLGASDRVYKVEVKATGYATEHKTFQPQTDLVLRIDLKRGSASDKKTTPRARKKKKRRKNGAKK